MHFLAQANIRRRFMPQRAFVQATRMGAGAHMPRPLLHLLAAAGPAFAARWPLRAQLRSAGSARGPTRISLSAAHGVAQTLSLVADRIGKGRRWSQGAENAACHAARRVAFLCASQWAWRVSAGTDRTQPGRTASEESSANGLVSEVSQASSC